MVTRRKPSRALGLSTGKGEENHGGGGAHQDFGVGCGLSRGPLPPGRKQLGSQEHGFRPLWPGLGPESAPKLQTGLTVAPAPLGTRD